ncbi:hypothetical protein BDV3_001579 [Batrachochytrium dendrobatidis]
MHDGCLKPGLPAGFNYEIKGFFAFQALPCLQIKPDSTQVIEDSKPVSICNRKRVWLGIGHPIDCYYF